ncbi:hypothetical protein Pelo_8247 [Pelomyxa schiedti]|nr:hypothetical protein Pelo_8247 [Pelomyxa schiedti]
MDDAPPPPPPLPSGVKPSTRTTSSSSRTTNEQLPPLPPGWQERRSLAGVTFYFNELTRARSYTRPTSKISQLDKQVPSLVTLCSRALTRRPESSYSFSASTIVPSEVADSVLSALLRDNLVCTDTLVPILQHMGRSLTRFVVSPSFDRGPSPVTSCVLSPISTYCSNLVTLDLCRCHKLSSSVLEQISRANPFLLEIDVSECPLVSGQAIENVVSVCRHLEFLACNHCMAINGTLTIQSETLRSFSVCSKLTVTAGI